ncbi:unnamed protein product [Sphacelaria rigidula]
MCMYVYKYRADPAGGCDIFGDVKRHPIAGFARTKYHSRSWGRQQYGCKWGGLKPFTVLISSTLEARRRYMSASTLRFNSRCFPLLISRHGAALAGSSGA